MYLYLLFLSLFIIATMKNNKKAAQIFLFCTVLTFARIMFSQREHFVIAENNNQTSTPTNVRISALGDLGEQKKVRFADPLII